jgi:acyl-CoA synthetase (AMP-forming)/AMP-acid ligase II
MLGYLNAPSPFDAEGWLNTGDAVIVDGEWFRILGRQSDMIIVGGAKVFPAEVESVLLQAPNVADALCYGEKDLFLGARVVAKVVLGEAEDPVALRERLRLFCLGRLDRFKVPIRFEVVPSWEHLGEFKKKRVPQRATIPPPMDPPAEESDSSG